jgi:hypothetical protein
MSEETESLLKQTAYRTLSESTIASAEASYSSATTERLGSDSEGLWIRSFLIKPGVNSRGWAIDRQTALQNVYSIVGKPLVAKRHVTRNYKEQLFLQQQVHQHQLQLYLATNYNETPLVQTHT